jgi:hypothetical protein
MIGEEADARLEVWSRAFEAIEQWAQLGRRKMREARGLLVAGRQDEAVVRLMATAGVLREVEAAARRALDQWNEEV